MSELKFTGAWIPAMVFKNEDLSNAAKLLYGAVAGLDGEDGCFASNAYLQRVLGVSERGIQTLLGELESHNLIVREQVNGRRIIRTVEGIALGGCKKLRGGVQNPAGEGCKKLHPYNKEDNKEDKDTGSSRRKKTLVQQLDEIPWTTPLPFSSEAFGKAWQSWIDYRKELKKPLKDSTVKAQWNEFVKWGEAKSIASIEQSIKNGWQGLFEPNKSFGGSNTKPLTARDHESF